MLINLQRLIKSGAINFGRNIWLSTAAASVMALSLFVITGLLLGNIVAGALLTSLEDKVDISVYFKSDTAEEDILKVKNELSVLGEVEEVSYVSAEKALKEFREKHKDNSVLLQSLEELDSNPLEANLGVKAREASQYEAISLFLENGKYKNLIDKVDFRENRAMIARLVSMVDSSRRAGIAFSLTLAAIAVLVIFNTIRLAIYNSREEIEVMRLVGAGNWYIRGPFLVEGILYGLAGSLVSLVVLWPILSAVSPFLYNFTQAIDMWQYFRDNFWAIAGIQTMVGVSLGILSSGIAIRRYLKV